MRLDSVAIVNADKEGRRVDEIFWNTHLLLNVIKRVRRVHGEANEDDVGVGVTERAKTVIIFLTCRIP